MNKKIILGGGCFWCTEAIFKKLKGIEDVVPGYTGGSLKNPTYKDICTGLTGHAEVIKISYNPKIIDFKTIIDVFFQTHDPTTLNRQGNDVGTQYRSSIFTSDPIEKKLIEERITYYNDNIFFEKNIVTKIEPENIFYEAEDYHHNYFQLNKQAPYCRIVISPKIQKLLKNHSDLLD